MMFDILHSALAGMTDIPKRLFRALEFAAEQRDVENFEAATLLDHLKTCPATDDALSALRHRLALWDNADGEWAKGSPRNSQARREVIYQLLSLDKDWTALCEERLQFHPLEEATVIAVKNTPWYTPEVRAARSFYWNAYERQLRANNWDDDAVNQLDQNTNRIVEKLANPKARAAYQSKGLVVGYVQSGKTANFTGLIAKAVDAGYRLIIVMAGLLDVLRSQTQRRIDKELIGRELLQDEYQTDPDYDEFVSHGKRPSELSAFDIYRLTGPDTDYKSLAYGKEALKFDRKDMSLPFWAEENLHPSTARIAVVKKHPAILQKLAADLRSLSRDNLGAPLDQVPVLIIDDESDQASINTAAPSPSGEVIDRTKTNKAIVGLLSQLPRSQYVGFTATPSANALIDPGAAEDIFPKDFLISLPRPVGYMGVADFYDLDLPSDGTIGPNQRDFVRSVTGEDEDESNLRKAIDSYVLSGAVKLFRANANPIFKFKHHTMLVHVSQLQADHKDLARKVQSIYGKSGYEGGMGLPRLEELFKRDFLPVYKERGGDLPFPADFEELTPFIAECLQKIGEPSQAIRIINTEHKKNTPDFDRERVWKILVGGAKLSRGYTVEGLTISYYRRRAGASDTLMQMGRWFGFRKGYQDLVRLFIGTDEIDGGPKSKKRINLYEAFGAICRDEEMFRRELARYAEDPDIIPAAIPPLVPAHMLRPTAPNKMRNARITFRNFGGELSESTYAPNDATAKHHNIEALQALIVGCTPTHFNASAKYEKATKSFSAFVFETSNEKVITFLKAYKWYDDKSPERKFGNPLHLQLEFLEGSAGDPGIDRWLILSPKISTPQSTFRLAGEKLHVVYRSRQSSSRFNTYNDKVHRAFARHIAGPTELEDASKEFETLKAPRTGVMLLYPITEKKGRGKTQSITVGFTLLFPPNKIRNAVGFTVHVPAQPFDALIDLNSVEETNNAD
ncbi:endonuclease [Stappia sp. BW2]|uniref:Z1 domain-containing protein n=1 Tax=Stappia sp. BW2 TaxID=2592622 RepID=UPI0011DE9AB5|nr:Z1 domain-containing protein [Stappia sp. BW2]TYC79871.1 endonuclease [Stappia sp. BW2]